MKCPLSIYLYIVYITISIYISISIYIYTYSQARATCYDKDAVLLGVSLEIKIGKWFYLHPDL